MDILTDFLFTMAPHLHFIAFGILMLSGMNVPISEDIIIIVSASIAATIIPENRVYIFIGCFLGAFLSDWVAYGIGRFLGPKIFKIKIFQKLLPTDKILKLENYFERYHAKTLFFGRFIPFGIRNVLFFTSGLVKLNFFKFITVDFFAIFITCTIQFFIGYTLGENYKAVFPYLNRYKFIIMGIFIIFILFVYLRKRYLKKQVIKTFHDEISRMH